MAAEQVISSSLKITFYDLLQRDVVVMADQGFQIQEDLLLHYCNLQIPPGARTKSQMTKKEVQKRK